MNRISYALLAFGVSLMLLINACSKKPNDGVPPTTTSTDKTKLNSLFAAFRSTPEVLTVTAGVYQSVKGAKGTKLTFYPNSFTDKNGNVITSGTIDLKLIEMYKPGDMIANRATTVYKDGLLESGGQIYVTATKDGETVNARKYGISYANATTGKSMRLYPGNTANEDSVVTWDDPLSSVGTFCVTGTVDTTSTTGNMVYKFDSCTTFNWVNCDVFYSDTSVKTKVFLTTNDKTLNSTNTQVFVIFPSINSAASLSAYDAPSRRFQLMGAYTIPEGLTASFIVMANKNGTYYYYEILNQTITTNMVIDASAISVRSIDYIKDRLSAL